MLDFKGIKDQYDCRVEVEKALGPTKGNKWLCPFHHETSPSFQVYKNGYYCFGCGVHGDVFDWWSFWTKRPLADVLRDNSIDLTPEQIQERKLEAAQREIDAAQEKINRAQAILNEIRSERRWEQYHANLDRADCPARSMLEARGLPVWYQDYRQLGYDPDHDFFEYRSPTLTLPYFDNEWQCTQIKHRLLADVGAKYRPEKSGLPNGIFLADPAQKVEGKVVVVEGEFKAAVVHVTDPSLNVIGLPGSTPSKELLDQFSNCTGIWLNLDPGAETSSIVNYLGKERVRVVRLPDKIDDLIVYHNFGKEDVRGWLRQARKQ